MDIIKIDEGIYVNLGYVVGIALKEPSNGGYRWIFYMGGNIEELFMSKIFKTEVAANRWLKGLKIGGKK